MKLLAADEGRQLRDVATEIVRCRRRQDTTAQQRVKLPLIQCEKPTKEMTAELVAAELLKQKVEWMHETAGR